MNTITMRRGQRGTGIYGPRIGAGRVHLGYVYGDLYGFAGFYRPIVHGAIPYGLTRSCAGYLIPRSMRFKLTLPHLSFRTAYRLRRVGGLWAYSVIQRAWRLALTSKEARRG